MIKRLLVPSVDPGTQISRECDTNPDSRYLSEAESRDYYERILSRTRGGGHTEIQVISHWTGYLRWANNRIITSGNIQEVNIGLKRRVRGSHGSSSTNRLDDEGLNEMIARAEWAAQFGREQAPPMPITNTHPPIAKPEIFFQRTIDLSAVERSRVARGLVEPSNKAGLRAAGYVEVKATTSAVHNTDDLDRYYAMTQAQYSVTVRTPDGTASGWAGMNYSDWNRIDATALSARAQQKCEASRDPRRIEPGRYTVILEPQAVYDLVRIAFSGRILKRSSAEDMAGHPYHDRPSFSKIGMRIVDERLSASTDPMDPDGGYIPFSDEGEAYQPTTWLQNGVLVALPYERRYSVENFMTTVSRPNPVAFRMSGGNTSIDEMIATTRRGLLVTRFSNIEILDTRSLQCTGVTRDGLWLVQDGKISMPVRNFRFIDSPLFALNNVDAIGESVRVFSPGTPSSVPFLKIRDFNMSSTIDAI